MFKKGIFKSLDANFWTCVLMELTGSSLPYLDIDNTQDKPEFEPVAFGLVVGKGEIEKASVAEQFVSPE